MSAQNSAPTIKNKKEITILAPELDPSRYTNFIIRKDYDDERYDRKFFEKNVEYGGLAFSKNQYQHLPIDIESTIPDFEVYEKYKASSEVRKPHKVILLNY